MKKNKILKVIFGVALVSLPLAAATAIKTGQIDRSNDASIAKDQTELNRIVDVINIVEKRFVGKEATPSKKDLYEGAVAGIIGKLNDPYSEYGRRICWGWNDYQQEKRRSTRSFGSIYRKSS